MNIQDFYTGHAFDLYEVLGAHPGPAGTRFAVWAPAARAVSVVGDWSETETPLQPSGSISGVWEGTIPGAGRGMAYFYRVTGADGNTVDHCDPCGFAMALRPAGRSLVAGLPAYSFGDGDWMARRGPCYARPLNIYEVHAGSWRRKPDGSWHSYEELAEQLPAYCRDNGYTHLELMPLAEHPYDGSWGYQITGFYAPTSRYGTPEGLCRLVDACHRQGIGVILDFVPVHFAVDDYGLRQFDGTALYEYPAAAVGQSEWGSCNFMHSRGEVRSFLQSCADYWLRVFHLDGLRFDAVSRLLYWQGDPGRGVNGCAVDFLREMNRELHRRHPGVMLIAEDSSNYPKVTAPVEYGGLGFDYKWDLGWMNDTLDYFKKPPAQRRDNLDRLTFSMVYAWNEHYLLPFSHDENIHGKATIAQKMYGDYAGKFPQARELYLYMMIHPGKKLDFMGNEFAQLREWDETREQDWMLLAYPNHDGFFHFRAALHRLYREEEAFWSREYDPAAFAWLDCSQGIRNACAVLRHGWPSAEQEDIHFSDETLEAYHLQLPRGGRLTLLLDTDWTCWGGATPQPFPLSQPTDGRLTVTLPPYSARLYRLES